MKSHCLIALRTFGTLLVSGSLYATSFQTTTNFQGFTGIINTPTAEILEDQKVTLQYGNQVDAYRIRDEIDQYKASQYFINFGFLPNLEFSGRLANIEDKKPKGRAFLDRDLSASLKYRLPINYPFLPHIAVGIQDLSGTADRYKSKFIVMTHRYGFVRASLGYGFASKQLDGLFGGLEVEAAEWCHLLGEYDTTDARVGLRLISPELYNGMRLTLTGNKNITDKKEAFSFALSLQMPLGSAHHEVSPPQNRSVSQTENIMPSQRLSESSTTDEARQYKMLKSLSAELATAGLENIDVGVTEESLYVAYENSIFGHNELDALGVVLGIAAMQELPYRRFTVVIKKSNQPIRVVRGDLKLFKAFIEHPTPDTIQALRTSLYVDTAFPKTEALRLVTLNANSSYLKTRIELAPGLKTFVATEIGAFDYLLSFRPYLHWNLYQGFDLGILADFPLLHSHNFDRKHGVFRTYNEGNQLLSAMLHRTDSVGDFVNILSLGVYKDYTGGFENLTYNHDVHTFSLKLGYLEDKSQKIDTRKIYLADYTYYIDTYDLFLSLQAGKYYNQDNGFEVRMKRFFGDTAITLFYQNTTQQYAGVGIELPLTPRSVPFGRYVQFTGKNDFSYRIRSSIKDAGTENNVNPSGAVVPALAYDIQSDLLNRNRLNISYLQKHILRMRNAYFTFVNKKEN